MNFLEIGNRFVNLDLVTHVEFLEGSAIIYLASQEGTASTRQRYVRIEKPEEFAVLQKFFYDPVTPPRAGAP
jgi:hypothetical protein